MGRFWPDLRLGGAVVCRRTTTGVSDIDFVEDDEFTVADLFECLRFANGELRFSADYLRGRCMKTDITVRRDGRVSLSTRNRGQAALRWLDRLQGKKNLRLV